MAAFGVKRTLLQVVLMSVIAKADIDTYRSSPFRSARFERPRDRMLGFDGQLRLAPPHKESSGYKDYRRYKHERDDHPTLQSFELAAEPIP